MGIRVLTRVQAAQEAVFGTTLAATELWQMDGMMKDDQERVFPVQGDAYLHNTALNYLRKEGVTININDGPATAEHICHLFEMGIVKVFTGVVDGIGSGKVYAYPFPLASAQTPATYTIEGGDDIEVGEASACFAEEVKLKWAAGEELTCAAKIIGRQWTDCEFTALAPSVTLHHLTTAKLFLDATGSGILTTQKTSTFMGFELTLPSGFKPIYTGDGQLYYTFLKYVGHKEKPIEGVLTMEHDALGEAELNFARAGTLRLCRVLFQGAALATPTATWTHFSVEFKASIQYTDVPELEDEDGNNLISLPFRVIYSLADTAVVAPGSITVVNELTTLV